MVAKLLKNKQPYITSLGFTIIELLVTISIFAVVTTSVIANIPKFDARLSVDLLAHDIALSIRQAQVYTLSVKALAQDFPSYGIRFDMAEPKQFVFFADKNGNKKYDVGTAGALCGSSQTECVTINTIEHQAFIGDLCGTPDSGTEICNLLSGGKDYIDIVFMRPEPEANLFSSERAPSQPSYSVATIKMRTGNGEVKHIVVYQTGQISVENAI